MAKEPWTDPDPQPGDFDAYLASIDRRDPSLVEVHAGNPDAKLTRVVRVSGEDAARLEDNRYHPIVPTRTQVRRGGRVARQLGWPPGERGFVGALGGLVDPASFEFRRPRSTLLLIDRYQRQSDAAVRKRVLQSLRRRLGH